MLRPKTALVRKTNHQENEDALHHRPHTARDGINRRVSFSDQDKIHIHPNLLSTEQYFPSPQIQFQQQNKSISVAEKYKIPQKPPPEKGDLSSWDDFEPLPENPSVLLRKDSNAPGSRPQSSASRTSNPFFFERERERTPFKRRPLSASPVSMIKSQTVRSNLDKYRIELIMLRRIRYLVDAKTVNESHMSMISMLENSNVPQELLITTFGKAYSTLYSIRVLMCGVIEDAKARSKRLGIPAFTPKTIPKQFKKKVPTTPQSVLDMLQTLEKKTDRKKYKFQPVDWETTKSIIEEEKVKRAQSARPQTTVNMTREEVIAGLAFLRVA